MLSHPKKKSEEGESSAALGLCLYTCTNLLLPEYRKRIKDENFFVVINRSYEEGAIKHEFYDKLWCLGQNLYFCLKSQNRRPQSQKGAP